MQTRRSYAYDWAIEGIIFKEKQLQEELMYWKTSQQHLGREYTVDSARNQVSVTASVRSSHHEHVRSLIGAEWHM